MKRISTLFIWLVLCIGAVSQPVTRDEAAMAAQNWLGERAHAGQVFIPGDIVPIVREGLTVFYAVNFYPSGFVLLSANQGLRPVAAYSFTSQCYDEGRPANVEAWLRQYEEEAAFAIATGNLYQSETREEWQRLLSKNPGPGSRFGGKSVEPLTVANWNQDWPYNEMCPPDPAGPHGHCYAGCVPTAMGLVMYYYRWPDSGSGYYSYTQDPYGLLEADFGNTRYRWEEMTNSISDSDSAIAELLYHLGVSCDLVYGPNGSGMYNHRSAYALRTFFRYAPETRYVFRDSTSMNWDSLLVAHLDRKMPMYYAGWSVPNINGHAFVCDGYQGSGYFHFNFGWGGSYNGYYYTNNLSPGGSNFNLAQEVIINCHPDTLNYTYPGIPSGQQNLDFYVGSIEDGSGPRYPHSGNSTQWLISPQNSQDSISKIRLQFHRFDLAQGADYLRVYDGPDVSSPLLGEFSGSTIPPAVESTGNELLVAFSGNPASGRDGFFATYGTTRPQWCSGTTTLTELSGIVGDGSGDFWYYNSSVCLWKIQPPGVAAVALHFTKFKTEAGFDKVKIYDFATGDLLAEYSGHYSAASPPPPVLSPSGKMYITFNTNGSIRDDGWEGWYESYMVSRDDNRTGGIQVFPNPASDLCWLRLPDTFQRGEAEITDLNGRILRTIPVGNHSAEIETIDLNGLKPGFYLLRIVGGTVAETVRLMVR